MNGLVASIYSVCCNVKVVKLSISARTTADSFTHYVNAK
jgi:hypothetical protein